jgi:hypothetical protein
LLAGIIGLYLLKSKLLGVSTYEQGFLGNVLSIPQPRSITGMYSFKFLINSFGRLYFWSFVLVAINSIYLFIRSFYLLLLYYLGFLIAFLVVTIVVYQTGDSDIMMERSFMPLALFAMLPLVKMEFRHNWFNRLKVAAIAVLLLCAVLRIYNTGTMYQQRTDYVKHLLDFNRHNNVQKVVTLRDSINMKIIEVPWAFAFETLLLSSGDGNPSQTVFVADEQEQLPDCATDSIFLGAHFWLKWRQEELNTSYFILPYEDYIFVNYKNLIVP